MHDWLLHMTETQRIYAVGLIDAVLEAASPPANVPSEPSSGWSHLTVRGLYGRGSGASVSLSRGMVSLRTPLSPRRGRIAAELSGPACPPIDVVAKGDIAVMIVALVRWRSALCSPVTEATTADVQETARAAGRLLRGAVHAHMPDWEMAALQSSRQDGHVLLSYSREPDGRQLGHRFTSRPTLRRDGGMTGELVGEIDRILGGRAHAHVVEEERWKRYRLRFDATPAYCVSPTCDPMTTLRALNALPSGARLAVYRSGSV